MKILVFLPYCLGILLILGNYSCTHDPIGIEDFDTVCFSRDVLPIFQNSCALSRCHDGNNEGFNATTYESIKKAVVPGNANKSRVYSAITSIYINRMPPSPHNPLSKDQRTIIALWINQGANNTRCDPVVPSSPYGNQNNNIDSVCFAQTIQPILRSSCGVTGCHDPITHKEGYDFSSYATLMKKNGTVVPFNPNTSKLYRVITTNELEDRMPPEPRSRLRNDEIDAIRKWISEGALDSDCPVEVCDTLTEISFSKQVLPVFQRNCTGCHGTVSPNGNISLNNYDQIKFYAENGRNGVPFITSVLNGVSGFKSMPPYGSLDKCSIRTIELWINQGKPNN